MTTDDLLAYMSTEPPADRPEFARNEIRMHRLWLALRADNWFYFGTIGGEHSRAARVHPAHFEPLTNPEHNALLNAAWKCAGQHVLIYGDLRSSILPVQERQPRRG